jgi:shikimate dehydrogenase
MLLTAKSPILALLGDPVSHSLSPVMQNGWLEDAGLDGVYVALQIKSGDRGGDSGGAFQALRAMQFYGANVTVPYKQIACLVADRLDPAAGALKAANVLRWEEDGTVSGYNTDAPAIVASLDDAHSGWRSQTGAALVVGAGGAGRAAAWALAQAGVHRVMIANRTRAKADEVAKVGSRCEAHDWDKLPELFAAADLIVNCSSLGMVGSPGMDWPVHRAPKHCVVMDAVYAPLETDLLRQARGVGLNAVDGLGMLIHQGALAFDIWFDMMPSIEAARVRLTRALAEREA